MARLFSWVGRHTRAIKLGSILGAFVLLSGGLALGMNRASGSPAPRPLPSSALAVDKVPAPSRHYLLGTVFQAFKSGQIIVRGKGGRFYVIDYDGSTSVRMDRHAVPATRLKRGTRVIILGGRRDDRYHADVITITGVTPTRPLPSPSAGAGTPAAPLNKAPHASVTATPVARTPHPSPPPR